MARPDILSMDIDDLKLMLSEMGEPAFRAKQLFQWLHQKQVNTFDQMSNLPKALQQKLADQTRFDGVTIEKKLVSSIDQTAKYLFALENGALIESVLMHYGHGSTVCVSTQAGCRMGCTFCASTLEGVECNLTAGEMLSQVYAIQKDTGNRVSGIVLMGSGEPLDNYENVLQFIKLANDPQGVNIGQRHITLSTCGLIEKIHQLAAEGLQITLAVSLHAPNDEIRNRIMPISRKNPIEELLAACRKYADITKRRITFEYALMKGVNDSDACALELVSRLRHTLCHVNLIPMNEVKERSYSKSSDERVARFASLLNEKGIETTVRRRMGMDINAACGQLRRGYKKNR